MEGPRFLLAGDAALVVEYGSTADPAFHGKVLALAETLAAAPDDGILETVPTYRSLLIHFDPRVTSHDVLEARIRAIDLGARPRPRPRCWHVPACYDDDHGEDLGELAALLGMDAMSIADLHAGATYQVVMYGFAPGFVFLSGLPDALRVSRRPTPRPPAKPGALTIANGQTLIASVAMPTGWYVLGRTPARTFEAARDPAFPIATGDTVVFERVDAARFDALLALEEAGTSALRADQAG